ncbi:PEGA domain-containing protein [Methanoregula sp.]|uniref:PEGA domain-containing protein n=1 Tax=Methanoregula sp. TaxID=2052170 RepID=UPI00236A8113|nr:PEGA domain-containing protein [Methanoregula sp.]MDD1686377.1 PEGA domain-containing protein [Methanoregula sp.]
MKRFPHIICLVFLLLLFPIGIATADTATENTTTATPTATTPARTGGTVYFETVPSGATIWLDNVKIGTSKITYFSEKSGTLDVRIQMKGYDEYKGTVTVIDGQRVDFYARLNPVTYDWNAETTPTVPVTTVTTIRRSTMTVPTSWPTPTPESPFDPAFVIGALTLGIGLFVIRRR